MSLLAETKRRVIPATKFKFFIKLITFVKGRPNFSCKSTTAANIDLTESILDNWLKNNHNTVDKIYYLRSLFVFFLRILVFKFISQPQKTGKKNRILWQLAKIRPERISQSNGSIDRPLGLVIDRLNTSASLYSIAPCLSLRQQKKSYCCRSVMATTTVFEDERQNYSEMFQYLY